MEQENKEATPTDLLFEAAEDVNLAEVKRLLAAGADAAYLRTWSPT